MQKLSPNLQGIIWIVLGMFIFSFQNIAIKWISGGYPVLEIVIFRSLVALPLTWLFFRMEGNRGLPKSKNLRLELIRGFFLFLSYTTYFMGLSALPLAEAASIRFSAPLTITALSVLMLGEKVGPRRWMALVIGFTGVLFIVRPGTTSFNWGSVFVFLATIFYALSLMLTRRLRGDDSSATMAYFSTVVYLASAFVLAPTAVLIGEMPNAHPSVAFLFRAWSIPTPLDLAIMLGLGFIWASGMFLIAKAYSLALASVAAPFEYVTLPINVMWGYVIWQEVPTTGTWLGAGLTLASGLYILFRETKLKETAVVQPQGAD
ncbi:MAG: DMT family transporter [Chloroflexota bacterium]